MSSLLIIAGVYLSARIISFIAETLTDEELNKQEEIKQRIAAFREERDRLCLEFREDNDPTIRDKEYAEKIRQYLMDEASKRKSNRETFKKELIEARKQTKACLNGEKQTVHTPLRKNSLELLLRQLSKAIEQCDAYLQYLSVYERQLSYFQAKTKEAPFPMFSMLLPSEYPYVGKIIWVNINQINNSWIVHETGVYPTSVLITDIERTNSFPCACLPAMITKADKNTPRFYASFEKGDFVVNSLANTHVGFDATVTEIRRNCVILTYKDSLKMILPRDNLFDPYRFPPVQSVVTVYPVNWSYDLNTNAQDGSERFPVTVSEKKQDALSSFQFETVPVCFSQEELHAFCEYYSSNNLAAYEDKEFLIGLENDTWTGLHKGTKLRLQLGDLPLLVVSIDEQQISIEQKHCYRYFFRFDHICSQEEKSFSASDVFVPFDVSITPYIAGTTDEKLEKFAKIADLNDVSAYIWDIAEELRLQDQIRKTRKGIQYFYKWESITDQLISFLEKGEGIPLQVEWLPSTEKYSLYATVRNVEDLKAFINSSQNVSNTLTRVWNPQFFIEDDHGNRFKANLKNENLIEVVGGNLDRAFGAKPECVAVYLHEAPYAEYQQISALRQFRMGQVVNTKIQAACIDSSSIVPEQVNDNTIRALYNSDIQKNPSQRQIIECALKEKNLYLIQGPPGTGKTTVIRELVEQLYNSTPLSRILIVSQANVAVDNVLKGLVGRYRSEIVRCGNSEKISDDHQELRLERRCEEYLDDLKQRKTDFEEAFYASWESKVQPKDGNFLPALYELILRNHRLIGATCVGLSQKKIGLDRTSFDLVIVDEAGKALPAEMMIPLLRAKKAIIIGDHKQLPPVINPVLYDSERIDLEDRIVSENELFAHSFFERLFENAPDSCRGMLDTQYRMPAVIGNAISELFYEGKLKNGQGTDSREPVLFPSCLSFIDYEKWDDYREENDNQGSVINRKEAFEAFTIVNRIKQKEPECKIAVITPYKGQKRLIRETFKQHRVRISEKKIEIDTIDSFQGSEADVVIFCTTRSEKPTLFFRDSKRINVALSRPRRELIILGKMNYFYKYDRSGSCLPALADYIKKNGNIVSR